MKDLERAREYLWLGRFESAIYFAERALSRETAGAAAIELLVQCLLAGGEPRRALYHLERFRGTHPEQVSSTLRLFEARCLVELKLFEDLVSAFEEQGAPFPTANSVDRTVATTTSSAAAAYYVQVGDAYAALENTRKARECYLVALRHDENCVEAFQGLVFSNTVFNVEGPAEQQSAAGSHQTRALELQILQQLWPFETPAPTGTQTSRLWLALANDFRCGHWRKRCSALPTFFLTIIAARLWHLGLCQEAYRLLSFLVCERKEVELKRIMPLFVTILAHRRELVILFRYAHQLVEDFPRAAESWYAVALYYYASGKYDTSRIYFQKATLLNNNLAYIWVAYGHAFAALDDSEQALAAYRTAMRLRPDDPWPLLYAGMEFARQNHPSLAQTFFERAAAPWAALADGDADEDPLARGLDQARPWNELGVLCYHAGEYTEAVAYFRKAAQPLYAYQKEWLTCRELELEAVLYDRDRQSVEESPAPRSHRPVLGTSGIENKWPKQEEHGAAQTATTLNEEPTMISGCNEMQSFFATILSNLGHALIRLQLMDEAAEALESALAFGQTARITPGCVGFDSLARAETLTALGYVEHYRGNLTQAAKLYHEASRERAVSGVGTDTLLLNALLERVIDELAFQTAR
jgi:anaphase-promoting complex subunit 6